MKTTYGTWTKGWPAMIMLALAACASDQQMIAGDLEKATICCSSLSALPFSELGAGQSQNATLGPGYPVFDFPQGRSYLAAYRVAPRETARRLQFNVSLELALGMPNTAFALTLTELDERFATVAVTVPPMSYREPGLVTSAHLAATHDLAPATRHVVIHAGSDRVGKMLVYTYRATSGGYPVFLGRGGAIWIPGSSSTQGGRADFVRSGSVTTTLLP